MKRVRRPQVLEEPSVNLTPLIDVVFVILILFILIAPLLEMDQVELAEGHMGPTTVSVQQQSPISIYVRQDNSLWMNNRKLTLRELETSLQAARREYPSIHPQLFHDKKAHFGTYQSVKNAVENAGFESLDVILTPS